MSNTDDKFNFFDYIAELTDSDDYVRFDLDKIRAYFEVRNNSVYGDCTSTFDRLRDLTWAYQDANVPCLKTNEVYDDNRGDGNEWEVVFELYNTDEPENKIFLAFEGWYSSWDKSQMNHVALCEPYEYTETRYRKIEKNS